MEQAENLFLKKAVIAFAVIVSGFFWYISTGLNGDFYYFLWLAPIPVLLISFKAAAKTTFFISFIAYLIGRLSWFSYLVTVATLLPAIVFTIALPLFFALIMSITRIAIIKNNSWYSIFAFPVFFTTFEWLMISLSPDGTAGSIAYSQSNFLPLVQITATTGILGITFIVTFIPSALALGWYYRKEKNKLLPLAIVSFIIISSVLFYGFFRIKNNDATNVITAGLVVLDEETHKMGNKIDFQNELQHTKNYAEEIARLATQGAAIIVLPERALNINKESDSASVNILSNAAKQNRVVIVSGYTNFKSEKERNSALVIDAKGNVVMDYNKVHLVKGLEEQFIPGSEIGLFKFEKIQAGVAICKDFDFPSYIKKYGQSRSALLCIPAWDFVVDDWLHSRMAILRGVENGFSEIRTARQGRLTISDSYGRVTSETNCVDGKSTALIGKVSLTPVNTFYIRYGDWFGILILTIAILIVLSTIVKKH